MQTLPIPELAFCTLRRKCLFPGGSSAGPAERGIKREPAPKLTISNGFHSHLIQLLTFSCHPAPSMCPRHSLNLPCAGCCCCCCFWDVLRGFCSSCPLRAGPTRCRISWQGCKGSVPLQLCAFISLDVLGIPAGCSFGIFFFSLL